MSLWPVLASARTSNDPNVQQYAYEQTGVYRAWDYATGSSDVIVAIIDNGFDTFHPDLFQNVWHNPKEIPDNEIDDDHNGYVDDVWGWNFVDNTNDPRPNVRNLASDVRHEGVYSHATVVAGIIGAVGNNGRDGVGVNWRVKLMNVKVIDNSGMGTIAPLGRAIRYAVDNGAKIINISMVGDKDDDLDSAVQYAYNNGVVIIAAAGNYGGDLNKNPLYPVCIDASQSKPMLLGVSATDQGRKLAYFSNIGSNCIDITAPGADIGSTVRYSPDDGLNTSYSTGWQGTSFAAPIVTGAAALVKSVRPDWEPDQIYDDLLKTTHHTPAIDEVGYANWYGKGLLQVHRAVANAMSLPLPPTMFEASNSILTEPAKPMKTQRVKAMALVDGVDGTFHDFYSNSNDEGATYQRDELRGADSLASFGIGNQLTFIVAKQKNKKQRTVSVYNYKWQLQNSWSVPLVGLLHLSAGMIDDEPTIVVSPRYADKIAYELYSLNGTLKGIASVSENHSGASSIIVNNKIYSVFALKKQPLKIHVFENFKEVTAYQANDLGRSASIAAGDLRDGKDSELILGSGSGVGDMVAVYALDGNLIRSFSPFGDGVKNGIMVDVFDADHDGALDIVTYRSANASSVRAWNSRAKLETEWIVPIISGRALLIPR